MEISEKGLIALKIICQGAAYRNLFRMVGLAFYIFGLAEIKFYG